ncbi:MAG: hypothetical protein R2815_14210 [Flavobacteriales bacterium]
MKPIPFAVAATALVQCACAQTQWTLLDTTNTPLERNVVSLLAFDGNGDLWTTTEWNGQQGLGLWRFDGTQWHHYDAQDHPALAHGVRCASADADGNMWFCVYQEGLLKFDGTTWTRFTSQNSGLPSDLPTTIHLDPNGALWVGLYFDGLARFDGSTWTHWDHSTAPFPPDECVSVVETYDDKVWVGLDCGGGLVVLDLNTGDWSTVQGLPHNYVSALKHDGQGTLYVGYTFWGNWLSRFDGSTWSHEAFPTPYHGVVMNSIAVDLEGEVWCSALGLWNVVDGGMAEYGEPLPSGGPGAFTQAIAIGADNSLWWAADGIWTDHHFTTGIARHEDTSPLILRPNPALDRFSILLPPSTGMLRLFDARGALVREQRHTGGTTVIERIGLPAGAYTVVAIDDDGTVARGRVVFE